MPDLLTSDESAVVNSFLNDISVFAAGNSLMTAYYEGTQRLRDLGISIPPEMQSIETVVGWPGIAVDVLEERLDWLGWVAPGEEDFGLGDVYRDNQLGTESSLGHLDALIYGVSFEIVGRGGPGEPEILVTVESPLTMTVTYDSRTRRVTEGLAITATDDDTNQITACTWYRPNETARVYRVGSSWAYEDRDQHNMGRPPVSRLVNRPWGARTTGRSEITRAIRYQTDHAVRTLLGAEVAREFYSAPQRWVMGADQASFVDAEGDPIPAWQTYLGRVLALSADEDGQLPNVGQFPASSPAPYFDQLRALAQLFAGEAGLPASYLGFATDNPASADAIKAGEARLLKRAERRQAQLGLGHIETGANVLMVRDQEIPDEYRRVALAWRDPSTPTKAAQTDAAVKLIQSGVLPADSAVTYDYIGLSPSDQQRLASDRRRADAMTRVLALRDAATANSDPTVADLAGRRTDGLTDPDA